MRHVVIFLSIAMLLRAGHNLGAHVEYVGGTRADIPNGAGGTIEAVDEQYFVFYSKGASVRVPYERISAIEYGQKVDRRYLVAVFVSPLFVLSKQRKHFLTLAYVDEAGLEQAMIFRVDKDHIRAMLVSLEARTGKKVDYQDIEARKAGKG
jgi:hypothetical protein